LRGITLAASKPIQLLAREPLVGAAMFAVLMALVVWAGIAKSTLIGALLPALAILAVLTGFTLLTIATATVELPLRKAGFWIAAACFLAVPLAYGLLVLFERDVHDAANSRLGPFAAAVVAIAAFGAAAILLLALASRLAPHGRAVRAKLLWTYRFVVTGALAVAGVGFLLERWVRAAHPTGAKRGWAAVADERRGTIFVLVLVAALLLASALLTFVAWLRDRKASTG
jgi:hypothetical protein